MQDTANLNHLNHSSHKEIPLWWNDGQNLVELRMEEAESSSHPHIYPRSISWRPRGKKSQSLFSFLRKIVSPDEKTR